MPKRVGRFGLFASLLLAVLCLLRLDFGPHPPPSVPDTAVSAPVLKIRSASTTLIPQPDARVTVADGASLSLEISTSFRVEPVGGGPLLWRSGPTSSLRATSTTKGIRLGSREWPVTSLEIVPETSPAIWVNDHQYRGRVRLHRVSGKLRAVNVLPLEEYVASVVDSEMPAAFPLEARKAQAIAARTFAVYQRQAVDKDSLAELTSTVKSQKYLGFQYREGGQRLAGESETSRQAARETLGQICTLRGQPFCTYYCAVCGGRTMLGSEVFEDAASTLQSVPCTFCHEARLYRWNVEVERTVVESDVRKFLANRGDTLGQLKSLRLAGVPKPGQLSAFEVRGDRRAFRMSGAELRQALSTRGISSPRFIVYERNGKYTFAGQGHGHGAGLCQWGSRGLAQEGRTASQIIQHYYPGATIQTWPSK